MPTDKNRAEVNHIREIGVLHTMTLTFGQRLKWSLSSAPPRGTGGDGAYSSEEYKVFNCCAPPIPFVECLCNNDHLIRASFAVEALMLPYLSRQYMLMSSCHCLMLVLILSSNDRKAYTTRQRRGANKVVDRSMPWPIH